MDDHLLERLRRFHDDYFPDYKDKFQSLVEQGQHPTILFVGTYEHRKRGRLLVETFERDVRPQVPVATLWMVCQDAPTDRPERSQQGMTRRDLVKQFSDSPTCSNVRASCDRGIVKSHCARTYAECMRTGRWNSGYSNFEGLAKR